MKVLIVSGFLGAGKTTFIKELIRRSGTRPVIMENEYGENNLDAQELQQSLPEQKEMKILEFMEGCVCCTMKDSFVNSVLTIFSGLDPEYLVIEPTGVGRLGSIMENLKPILHDNIQLLKPVVVLSPRTYDSNLAEWPSLYGDQIANAGIVVFSKGEHEDPAVLESVKEKVRELNPDAEIISDHYSKQPDEWFRSLMELPGEVKTETGNTGEEEAFTQVSFHSAKLNQPSELVLLLEDCLRGEFGHIARAKGILPVGDELLRYDLADRQYAITGAPEGENQNVFIGKELDAEGLARHLGTSLETEKLQLFSAPQKTGPAAGQEESTGQSGNEGMKMRPHLRGNTSAEASAKAADAASQVRLETKDLILKKAVFEDWEPLYRNISSKAESAKYMLWKPDPSEKVAKERMLRTLEFEKKERYGLLVYLKTDHGPEAIGWAAMREAEPGIYEDMGIAVGPAFVRKGYGKQILNALCEEAKKQGAMEFRCSYREKNIASKALQDACGFEFDYRSEEKTDPRNGEKYFVINTKKML